MKFPTATTLSAILSLSIPILAFPAFAENARDTPTDDWHFTLCSTSYCAADPNGPISSCYDMGGIGLSSGGCTDTSVRTGQASSFNDWQSFRMLGLSDSFIEQNCSLLFYTSDNIQDYYCRPDLLVGRIGRGDEGRCHAPYLPGAASGLGITSFSLECGK